MKLNEKEILDALSTNASVSLEVFDNIDSTNDYLKVRAANGAPEGTVVIASYQTSGKGRMGRSFLSPDGSGIYMSILLRPQVQACTAILITACAAVSVCEAIEEVTGIKTDIKWVNDLYLNGKKVCGILTEGAVDPKNGLFEYAVLGIGVNLIDTFKDTELDGIASGLYSSLPDFELYNLRHNLIAKIIDTFFYYYIKGLDKSDKELLIKYRSRLFLIDKTVEVISYNDIREATVTHLNDDFTLSVRYADGIVQALNSGEVRLKVK